MIRIKFHTREDAIRGYYRLALGGGVRSLRGNVYEIREVQRELLDNANIRYQVIIDKAELDAGEGTWGEAWKAGGSLLARRDPGLGGER